LKNICLKPSCFFSNDCAGSIHGRTRRNSRRATRLASGSRPSSVSAWQLRDLHIEVKAAVKKE
jgi:hypothetical protein